MDEGGGRFAESVTRRHVGRLLPVLAVVPLVASTYVLVRASYFVGLIDATTHGTWMGALLLGSFAVGPVLAGGLGYTGTGPVVGVSGGVSPVLGMVVGAQVSVAAGYGRFDSSPFVLAAMLVGGAAILATVSWILGRSAGL